MSWTLFASSTASPAGAPEPWHAPPADAPLRFPEPSACPAIADQPQPTAAQSLAAFFEYLLDTVLEAVYSPYHVVINDPIPPTAPTPDPAANPANPAASDPTSCLRASVPSCLSPRD